MKILLFTLEYPPFSGGIAVYNANLVKYWPSASPLDKGGDGGVFVLHNNQGELVNNKMPFLKWLPAVWKLYQAVKKEKIDHILVSHILPLGTAAYLVSKILPIKYSVFFHGIDFNMATRSPRKRFITNLILKNAAHIFPANSYSAKQLSDFDNNLSEKIAIINPGIEMKTPPVNPDAQLVLKNKHNLHNKKIILYIGRLVKRKGADRLIEAIPEIVKREPGATLVIGGIGPYEKDLKEMANKLPEETRTKIVFIGEVLVDKWDWLDLCDIFAMPARAIKEEGEFEGFGIVYLEANLRGRAVVAGDCGGVRDAVENGVNGLLVDGNDINDIALAITKLLQDEALRNKLGEEGRARAIGKFGWQKQAEKVFENLKLKI